MDKAGFVYRINGLRDDLYAGKGLYPSWTVRGQKAALTKKDVFCTSSPVDMQGFLHRSLTQALALLSSEPLLQG
ncbi:MAG: hypothetical protein EOO80_04990 [Oxalobacteraceae bacterium]|nr:MAG: hypothetical protein EOO80_04990 [Oxalobacteraceae bacterium]